MKKIIKSDGKTYLLDPETKEFEEVEDEEKEKTDDSNDSKVEDGKVEEINTEETTEEDKSTEDVDESKLQEATDKVVASLGLDKLQDSIKSIEKKLSQKEQVTGRKTSALLDLETLMDKSVDKMTVKEKIVGFYQAMIQNNHSVLKALSEGTAADGGYLFPKFVGEIKLGELLGRPFKRIISRQAIN